MTAKTLLWMDLRTTFSGPDLCASLPSPYKARRLRTLPDLLQAMQDWRPWAACFEYDVLDARGLDILLAVKDRHSPLPVVMLVERPTTTLAKSAFRRYVWDCLIKPVSVRRLCNCLTTIEQGEKTAEENPRLVGSAVAAPEKPHAETPLAAAVSYVTTNYSEKLCQATAAKLCDLSPFQFSRVFKKAHGVTFRDFVVRVRIARAAELLKQSRVSVTEAAFVVGFNDLSYFARMFRRQLGVSPSHYRSDSEPAQMLLFPQQKGRC
ncbi:MAG TPA: DNA-binding response regulator [Terracidiphilus sp.]|jgi:AraC-like DNA-binding protein|nr:DNA-binding response regulator [Terracidiphilus sp.]